LIRIGQGFDIHKLVPGRELVLGGVSVPGELGFEAHSDGDVLVHALCDALFGAAGMKDIGTFFPDDDPAWKNADSLERILPETVRRVREAGFDIVNADATVVLDRPRLAPHVDAIRRNLAEALLIEPSRIAVKAKRTENCLFAPSTPAAMALVSVLIETSRGPKEPGA
jgi:2-C-methyl-D-erythritol 2,4-cyclodiphosphate synthase